MNGLFITLEGPEGSGKSTQAGILVSRLRERGLDTIQIREPGGTATGELIRKILQHDEAGEELFFETELFLFEASRSQLVRSVIKPAIEKGGCVVCDRFIDSTVAYQGYGRGFDVEKILNLNSIAIDKVIPDITILLDIDVASGFVRLEERNSRNNSTKDRIESEDISFHEKVRSGYLELAERWPERIKVVNADRDQKEVSEDIWRLIEKEIAG